MSCIWHMQILRGLLMLCVQCCVRHSFATAAKTRKRNLLRPWLEWSCEKGDLGCDDIPLVYIWRRWVDDRDREAEELSNAMTSGGARCSTAGWSRQA